MELNDAHVLITGASRGLGEAVATELARSGAKVTIVARTATALTTLADAIGATAIHGDLLDEDFSASLIERASTSRPVDVLVNNAGMEVVGHVADQSAAEIRAVLRLNLEVPAVLTAAVLPSMLEQSRGHIVNVSSMAMAVNTSGFATYGASKSGLSAFSGALRQELRGTGVDVTTVEIGTAETQMLANLRASAVQGVFARYEKLGMSPLLDVADVALSIRRAIENRKPHVRLPRRQAALPFIVNAPRTLGDLVTRGVPTR